MRRIRIVRGDFTEERPAPKRLSGADFETIKIIIREFVEATVTSQNEFDSDVSYDYLVRDIMMTRGFGGKYANGNDIDRAFNEVVVEMSEPIVDTPAELDGEGKEIVPAVTHQDFKSGTTFYPVEEKV